MAGRAAVEDEVDGERVGEGRIVVAQAERGEGEAKREGGEEAGEERAAVHGEGERGSAVRRWVNCRSGGGQNRQSALIYLAEGEARMGGLRPIGEA